MPPAANGADGHARKSGNNASGRGQGRGAKNGAEAAVADLPQPDACSKENAGTEASESWETIEHRRLPLPRRREGRLCNLSEYIDQTAALSQLKYNFLDENQKQWAALDYNTRTVLEDYPFITDYLIAHAYLMMNVRDVATLKHFIAKNASGTQRIVSYAVVSAARALIDHDQLKVAHYNSDSGEFVKKLVGAPILLSASSFEKAVRSKIQEFIFDSDEEKTIEAAGLGLGKLDDWIKPILVKYIQQSPHRDNRGQCEAVSAAVRDADRAVEASYPDSGRCNAFRR